MFRRIEGADLCRGGSFDYARQIAAGLFLALLAAAEPLPAAAREWGSRGISLWFLPNPTECSLSSATVNLGVFSRISNPAPIGTGDFGVDCSTNAYPIGYPHIPSNTYYTVEGGYCVTIDGSQSDRVLKGRGGNAAGWSIPFNFYFSRQKAFGANWTQDYDDPIGDGTWGIPYIEWNYAPGRDDRPPAPVIWGPKIDLPGRGKFDVHIQAPPGGAAYPAGLYTGSFGFHWRTGSTMTAAKYPEPAGNPGACSQFPGGEQNGVINVQLEIKKYCNIAVKQHINFGRQAFLNKELDQQGLVSADCSEGTLFGIGINDGNNSEAAGHRAMKRKGSNDYINYDVYKDARHTERWGLDWADDSKIFRGTGSAQGQDVSVYAAVPPQGGKPAGDYSDQLVVQLKIMDPGGP